MNSMSNVVNALVEDIKSKFICQNIEFPMKSQVSIDLETRDVHSALTYLKSTGWRQLSLITCVDWIEEEKFQLVYLTMNWENGIVIQVRTKIDRNNPEFRSITTIYPGAAYYERDVHEFFGVTFEGNPNSNKQLFLEIWDDMPPMRKDFDPLEYSNRKYPAREYKSEFSSKVGEFK